jgi:hypothetical protein
MDFFAIVITVSEDIAYWLLTAHPGAHHISVFGGAPPWGLLVVAGTFSVPLLLHAGLEAYYRLR